MKAKYSFFKRGIDPSQILSRTTEPSRLLFILKVKETFDVLDTVYNIKDLEDGVLEKLK
jgi:hypothetical protein